MSKSKIKQAFSHKKQAESAGKAGKSAVAMLKEVGSAAIGAFLGAGAGRYSMAVGLPLVIAGFYYDNWLVRGIGTGMAINTVVGSAGLSGMGDEAVNRMKSVAGAYKKTSFIDKAQEALGLDSNNGQAVAGLGYYSARKPFAGFGSLGSSSWATSVPVATNYEKTAIDNVLQYEDFDTGNFEQVFQSA